MAIAVRCRARSPAFAGRHRTSVTPTPSVSFSRIGGLGCGAAAPAKSIPIASLPIEASTYRGLAVARSASGGTCVTIHKCRGADQRDTRGPRAGDAATRRSRLGDDRERCRLAGVGSVERHQPWRLDHAKSRVEKAPVLGCRRGTAGRIRAARSRAGFQLHARPPDATLRQRSRSSRRVRICARSRPAPFRAAPFRAAPLRAAPLRGTSFRAAPLCAAPLRAAPSVRDALMIVVMHRWLSAPKG